MARMGRPKVDEPKTKTIGIRVTHNEYRVLKEYALKHDMTMTEMMLKGARRLIRVPET